MFIKRSIYPSVLDHLERPEMTLIAGPRQCGKTFLANLVIQHLQRQGQKTLFLNLDIEEHKKYCSSQKALVNKISLEFGDKKGYVFIDEIQRKEDAGLFLKGIYDLGLPHKIVATGSGSLELKEKIHESLAGRKKIFFLSTVSFFEFVNFKTQYAYEDRIGTFLDVEKDLVKGYLTEYLRFGGYPKVLLSASLAEKQDAIRDIFQSYVERDISALLHLEKTELVFQLLKLLSEQAGNIVNISTLANILGVSSVTIKKYLWYLEKTFIVHRVTPFTRRTGREISKSPIVYFVDIGLRNFVNDAFARDLSFKEIGFNFQNLVYNMLKDQLSETAAVIHYFRTKDGTEVDFVIESGANIIPLEAKYAWKKPIPPSLRSFAQKYKSEPGRVVTAENFYQLTETFAKTH